MAVVAKVPLGVTSMMAPPLLTFLQIWQAPDLENFLLATGGHCPAWACYQLL